MKIKNQNFVRMACPDELFLAKGCPHYVHKYFNFGKFEKIKNKFCIL